MAFKVRLITATGAKHLLCKSSHGHFYLDGQNIYCHVFQSQEDYQSFIADLKSVSVDDDSGKYDLDVFSLINKSVEFEEIPLKKENRVHRITR